MDWSDAERRVKEAREAERDAAAREQTAAQAAEASRRNQIRLKQKWVTMVRQFLAAMRAAGNPGMQFSGLFGWLTGKGYWSVETDYPPRARIRIRTDGYWEIKIPPHYNVDEGQGSFVDSYVIKPNNFNADSTRSLFLDEHAVDEYISGLAKLLIRNGVPVPKDNK